MLQWQSGKYFSVTLDILKGGYKQYKIACYSAKISKYEVSGRKNRSTEVYLKFKVKSKNRSTEGCSKLKSPETIQVQERLFSTLEHLQVPKLDRTRSLKE